MQENLREILLGGQSFSWREENGIFSAALNNRVYRIKEIEDAKNDPFLHSYFDMDFDYERARNEIAKKDEILKKATQSVGLLRILKQDEWTTAISFILSQNNNIKRITGLYNKLSMYYGKKIEEGYFSFPRPEDFKSATEKELRALGVGFRAPFILSAIDNASLFDEIKGDSYDSAFKKLQSIKGIGPKVASCILIFGYGRKEGFPIDTWMRQCLDKYYKGVPLSYFEPYPALCQQYLFSYMRNNE